MRASGYLHGEKIVRVWKPIKEFPQYEVSTWGEVRNARSGHILAQWREKKSEHAVTEVWNDKGKKHIQVRYAVAEAFLHDYTYDKKVDTISGNRMDVSISNLSISDNPVDKRRRTRVYIVELDKTFDSIYKAAKFIGGSSGAITKILNGFGHTHKGMHFERRPIE